MTTIILVDNIGKGSRIDELAKQIDGTIIQMSMAYWPKQVATVLYNKIGLAHPLVDMPNHEIRPYLKNAMTEVKIEQFLAANL